VVRDHQKPRNKVLRNRGHRYQHLKKNENERASKRLRQGDEYTVWDRSPNRARKKNGTCRSRGTRIGDQGRETQKKNRESLTNSNVTLNEITGPERSRLLLTDGWHKRLLVNLEEDSIKSRESLGKNQKLLNGEKRNSNTALKRGNKELEENS